MYHYPTNVHGGMSYRFLLYLCSVNNEYIMLK